MSRWRWRLPRCRLPAAALAQKDDKKRSKQEREEIEVIVKIVDGVDGRTAGADRRPDEDRAGVPEVAGSAHLRAVHARTHRPAARRTPRSTSAWSIPTAKVDPKKKVEYPWDDVHFVPAAQLAGTPARLNRVFMAKPGTYDVYIAGQGAAAREGAEEHRGQDRRCSRPASPCPTLNAEFTTSSILVADKVEHADRAADDGRGARASVLVRPAGARCRPPT